MKLRILSLTAFLLSVCIILSSCNGGTLHDNNVIDLDNLPPFNESRAYEDDGSYVVINNNIPYFTNEEKSTLESFENYSELDSLGRCGVAIACIGLDIMPTEAREDLYVEPSGWKQKYYDDYKDGKELYLYNRSHLIGFQLTGENNNEKNLITGTDYMNKTGMLRFENWVADYIEETGNHVMYRVTPIYEGAYDLVAKGVLMEAYSVEDGGDGICFNVFCYNVQPGIVINYYDGTSRRSTDPIIPDAPEDESAEKCYVLNTKTKKIHNADCRSVENMSEENKSDFTGILQIITNDDGTSVAVVSGVQYSPCGTCKPFE